MLIDAGALERYRLKLSYKVRWHLGSACPDVEDIVQESLSRFLLAVQKEKLRNIECAGAFLSGICNNVIHEYRRRIAKEPLSEAATSASEGESASEFDQIEVREAVSAALAQLSRRDQEILRAFFLEGGSKDEICASMGLSNGQFRVALFRAKGRFRENYNREAKQKCASRH